MRPRIPIGTVAEKSIVWRVAGTNSMIWPISTAKPMSSIRSASSSTRKWTPEKSSAPPRRGGEDHRLDGAVRRVHLLDDRDAEGRGLPRSRARLNHEVLAGEGEGDRLLLHGGRRLVALGLDAAKGLGGPGTGGGGGI